MVISGRSRGDARTHNLPLTGIFAQVLYILKLLCLHKIELNWTWLRCLHESDWWWLFGCVWTCTSWSWSCRSVTLISKAFLSDMAVFRAASLEFSRASASLSRAWALTSSESFFSHLWHTHTHTHAETETETQRQVSINPSAYFCIFSITIRQYCAECVIVLISDNCRGQLQFQILSEYSDWTESLRVNQIV